VDSIARSKHDDISRNEWKYLAEVKTQLDPDLPLVPCLAGEINQVLLNLVVNASHAIADVARQDGDPLASSPSPLKKMESGR